MTNTLALFTALALSISGCATLSSDAPPSQTARSLEVDVPSAPPEAPTELQSAAPGPGYIWVAGYFDFLNGRHVWRAGRWVESKPGYEYIRARYEWTGKAWVFHVPHWKKRHLETTNVAVR